MKSFKETSKKKCYVYIVIFMMRLGILVLYLLIGAV